MSRKKFYQLTLSERLEVLRKQKLLSAETIEQLQADNSLLEAAIANHMVENYITNFETPLGLVLDYLVDGISYTLPLATEEPSVIAAANHAGKIIRQAGGFTTTAAPAYGVGQIAFAKVQNHSEAKTLILEKKDTLIDLANQAYPSIVKRGGGAIDLSVEWRQIDTTSDGFLVVYLTVDTKEAMGANIINTMLEAIQSQIEQLIQQPALMAILSNYATEALTTAQVAIPVEDLSRNGLSGLEVAERIVLANQLACADIYRATTHNKGIMNGIDAFVLASGNDTRAVEAACHAHAARNGHYQALTSWELSSNRSQLIGELTLPMMLGSVGGTMSVHPMVAITHELMGHPSRDQLARLATCLGLGQNLAALLALVTEGIQKGHMSLQAESLALSVGAHSDEVPQVVQQLLQAPRLNRATASEILTHLRQDD